MRCGDHDEARFVYPGKLHITRQKNRQLASGAGSHYRVGAPLVRLERQIAISTLLRRLPDRRLNASPQSLTWRAEPMIVGIERLPIAFAPLRR